MKNIIEENAFEQKKNKLGGLEFNPGLGPISLPTTGPRVLT